MATGRTGELWRPLSDDGTGDEVRPSGNRGDAPPAEDGGARVGLFRPEVREARGVDCCDEDWRAERRPEGVDMTDALVVMGIG